MPMIDPSHLSANVSFDGVSITFREGTTIDEWRATGHQLATASKVAQWTLGDWLNFGSSHFKKEYKAAAEATGLAYGTLRTAASVAKRFPPNKRRITPQLSFEHHRLLAPIKDEAVITKIMDRVEREKLSANAMKELIPVSMSKEKTPKQIEAMEIAKSNRMREQVEKLCEYLNEIESNPRMHKLLLPHWEKELEIMAKLPFAKLLRLTKPH